MDLSVPVTSSIEDPPDGSTNNSSDEVPPPIHASEEEPSVPFVADDEGISTCKRKIDDQENNSENAEEPPVEEKKIRISVRKFFPEPPPPPLEEIKPFETIDLAEGSEYRPWTIPPGGNYCPDPELYQDESYDINQPGTSGLGNYHKMALQEYSPMSAEATAMQDMEIVRSFLNLILLKGNPLAESFDGTTSFVKEIVRIIQVNIDGLCMNDEMRYKMHAFCDTLNMLCDLSRKHLDTFEDFEPFILQYARIVNNILKDNNIRNYDERMIIKQKILDGVHSCKEHLDELTDRVTKSIVEDNAVRFKHLKGKKKILKDGTQAVVINLESSSDDEETPGVPPDGVKAYMKHIEEVLPLEVIPQFINLLTEKDPKTEELPLIPDNRELLISKTSTELSCINASEDLLVLGSSEGKVLYINLLSKEVIEEKIQDHTDAIISIEIWKKYIVTASDDRIRCLNLGKKFSRTVVLKDSISAMSVYGGLLHVGTNTGVFYNLSLPFLNFIGEPSKICDSQILSLNVIKGTQSSIILLGTSDFLYLWNKKEEILINRYAIHYTSRLNITPEFVISCTETGVLKALTSEIYEKNNWFLFSNPWSNTTAACVLNGKEGEVLVGCDNGEFTHFNSTLLFHGKVIRYEEGAIKLMAPWKDRAIAYNGTSIFYVPLINPMIKTEPVDPEEHLVDPEEHLLDPEEHLIDPEEHLVYPEEHLVYPEEHLVYPEEHLVDPEEHLVDPEEHPVDPEEHPVDPEEHPVDPDEHPVDPEEHPVDPEEHPVDPEEHPVDPEEHPIDPEEHPVDPGEHPVDPEEHPVDPEEHLVDPEEHPVDPEEHPVYPEQHPVDPEEHE